MALVLRTTVSMVLLVLLIPLGQGQTAAQADAEEFAWAVLETGLKHQRASHRAIAAESLGLMRGDDRAVQFAIHALKDENYHVRTAAAASLGQLRAKRSVPNLRDALSDSEVSVVLAATYSLYLLQDKKAYEVYYAVLMGDRKSSDSLIQAQLDRLKDPKQVIQLGFEEGIGFVPFGGVGYGAYKQLRQHPGSPARAAAARFLATDPDPMSEDALLQTALADNDELVRLAALDAIAQRGNPRCIERLAKNLLEDKTAVKYRTAATILHLANLQHGGRRKKAK